MAKRTNIPKYEVGQEVLVSEQSENRYREPETYKATIITKPTRKGTMWVVGVERRYKKNDEKIVEHKVVPVAVIIPVNENIEPSKLKEKLVKLTKPAIITGIILLAVLLIGGWFAGNYNDLVKSQNAVSNSRSKIDTELTRRYDLIDNIVASVEGSQAQESDVFGKIAEARKIGGGSSDANVQAEANSTIDTQIALLPRLQEAYPELRSNDQVTRLIQELQGTNSTIRDVRNVYNDTVTNYNNNIASFPKNIFAGVFGFNKEKLFEATKDERVNPKVEINRPNEQ